jgi:hypothetical protein
MSAKRKICTQCKKEKAITEYRRDRLRTDGRNSACKVCMRSLQSKRYKELYSQTRATRDKALRDENRKKLDEIKRFCGCSCCDEKELVCLEFHHRNSSQKDFTIGQNTHRTWNYIESEISKCTIVCSNCHKKIHAGLVKIP